MSSPADLVVLLGVGVLAGIVSTVASLASIVSYPALLALGLPPVSANMTNTVALMFTGVGAAAGSRPELAGQGSLVIRFGLLTAAGGGAGAALLLMTPANGFEYAAPVLIAAGSLVILRRPVSAGPRAALGNRAAEATGTPAETTGTPAETTGIPAETTAIPAEAIGTPANAIRAAGTPGTAGVLADKGGGWLTRAAVFAVAVYVGYFGAAGGILMLAVLISGIRQSLARTNALKNVVSGLANAVAGIGFAIFGSVRWAAALPLAVGFLAGGWIGPSLVRRMPAHALRVFIGFCGLALAIRLGISAYR